MLRAFSLCMLAGVAVLLPYVAPGLADPALGLLVFIMLGTGLNLEFAVAGLPDFAFPAYCAIGAYSDAILTREFGLPFWVWLPLGGLLPAAVALALTSPLMRLRPQAFAIMTLGFGAVLQIRLVHSKLLPAGSDVLTFPAANGPNFYYAVLAAVMAAGTVSWRVRQAPLGRALRAARENEVACQSVGLEPRLCKQAVVAVAAAIAGIAGCLLAAGQGTVKPGDFDLGMMASLFAIAVLGRRTQLGIVFAAIAIEGAAQLVPAQPGAGLLAGGAVVMLWAAARTASRWWPARSREERLNFANIIGAPAE